jgi:hypothetical protein
LTLIDFGGLEGDAVMNQELKLVVGDEAFTYLKSKEFQSMWDALYDYCPWATVYQSYNFVAPWYEIYRERYCPVIVFAEGKNGSLAGLLTLAFPSSSRRLTGAGDGQAEYQCWLEYPDEHSAFIERALLKISETLPGMNVLLRYLPPATPVGWIAANQFKSSCCLRKHPQPFMEICGPAMDRQRRKKNNRQNYNRLKNYGEVKFERITDHDQFVRIIDEIAVQHDLRHGAIHDVMLFLDDPLKKPFQIELHKRGILHTTVLKVGEKITASHSGLISKQCVHLCIITHSSLLAAHSPGALHLAMLGVQLAEEGIQVFDLTAGGDRYKESFATGHDTVYELNFYQDVKTRIANEALIFAKQFLKKALYRTGMTQKDAYSILGWLLKQKRTGFRDAGGKLLGLAATPFQVYHHPKVQRGRQTDPVSVSNNNVVDLLQYDPNGSSMTRREFLAQAMNRFEQSNDSYTYVERGKLILCCWVERLSGKSDHRVGRRRLRFSDNSILLADLYVHKKVKDIALIRGFIDSVILDLESKSTGGDIYLAGSLSNDLQTLVERCGFIKEQPRRFQSVLY